ncbi:hypothetical protein TRVL_01877 [Trypanosoma vivax]|nr:hypothetical protein TRVL_01877 [Trypanosoma vivax]
MSDARSSSQEVISPQSDRQCQDVLKRHFTLPSPTVACLLLQLNRDMTEAVTPQKLEQCVLDIQQQLQPHVEVKRIVSGCLPGSKLYLQFDKVLEISTEAEPQPPLMHLYIYAVDEAYSRPRILNSMVRQWRHHLDKTDSTESCLVMLYHQDLVDAARASVRQVSGSVEEVVFPDHKKVEAAVAAMEPYFNELRGLKLGSHQMCAYLPNEVPTRIVERLSTAYRVRERYLTETFDTSRRQQRSAMLSPRSEMRCDPEKIVFSLHQCWRRGYDLALHYLQFGMVSRAVGVFAQLYDLYYNSSDDYDFISVGAMETLGRMPSMLIPALYPTGRGRYPEALQDESEYGSGLLFIVACELTCLLLLGKRDLAFARYRSFLGLAREKFAEDDGASNASRAWKAAFLFRYTLSVAQMNWALCEASCECGSPLASPSPPSVCKSLTGSMTLQHEPDVVSQLGISALGTRPDYVANPHCVREASADMEGSVASLPTFGLYGEQPAGEDDGVLSSPRGMRRFEELCRVLKVEWVHKNTLQGVRILDSFLDGLLGCLVNLAALLGYRETGEVATTAKVDAKEVSDAFGMPELATSKQFVLLYRTLTEACALCCGMAKDKCREHAHFYKLAASLSLDVPSATVELCRRYLIPYVQQNGWLQLQVIVHRLHVNTTLRVMDHRKKLGELVLNDEEMVALKESIIYLISALGERGPLRSEIEQLCGSSSEARRWWSLVVQLGSGARQRNDGATPHDVDTGVRADPGVVKVEEVACGGADPPFSLSSLFRETRVFFSRTSPLFFDGSKALGEAVAHSANCSARFHTDMLRAKVGNKVFVSVSATCPVNVLEFENEEGRHLTTSSTQWPVVTLMSRNDWSNENEPLHVVKLSQPVSTVYSEETCQLLWTWEFVLCHTGVYRLHDIELQVASTRFVHLHSDVASLTPMGAVDFATRMDCFTESCGDAATKPAAGSHSTLLVEEPDMGVKLHVTMPREPHCFGDSSMLADVEIEVLESQSPLYALTDERCTSRSFRRCWFTEVQSVKPATNLPEGKEVAPQCSASAGPSLPLTTSCAQTPTSERAVGGIVQDIPALSCVSVSRPKNRCILQFYGTHASLIRSLVREDGEKSVMSLKSHVAVWQIEDGNQSSAPRFLAKVTHSAAGAFTTIPVSGECPVLRVPPILPGRRVDNTSYTEEDAADRAVGKTNTDGLVDTEEAGTLPLWRGVGDAASSRTVSGMHLSIPLLPLHISSGDDHAHVHLSGEDCGRDFARATYNRVSTPVPFSMDAAFSVSYSFKCIKNRVYCVVQVENVLHHTSLWLRGALLELLGDQHYTLSNVSSVHEHVMMRQWRPGDKIQLFFELVLSADTLYMRGNEMHHYVRVQLLYSNWSATEKKGSLETHILRPIRAPEDMMPYGEVVSAEEAIDVSHATHPDGHRYGVRYDVQQLEQLYATCNTFNGPVGSFISKHSCLFDVVVTARGGDSALVNHSGDRFPSSALPDVSQHSRVFVAGERICFSVTLSPLAYHWPEGSASEEEFLITFKADPSFWVVCGLQRLRRRLSMMEEDTVYFTAMALCFKADKLPEGSGSCDDQTFDAPFPTVELHWATGADPAADSAAAGIAIDVAQSHTFLRIQYA